MAEDVHGARIGPDLVLLDLQAGEYSLLTDLFTEAAYSPAERLAAVKLAVGREPPRVLVACVQNGFVDVAARPRALNAVPQNRLRATALDRRDFAAALVELACRYLGRSLKHLTRARRFNAGAVDEELLRRCASFAQLLPWAPFQGECLYRAYLLRLFLTRRGRGADWVFGVRTWPFRAHCWLECEGVVLNDNPARTALFTPILVA